MPPFVCAQLDYYSVLGVSPSATHAEINRAFRCLAWRWHPDRNRTPGATQEFQAVNEAHQVLADPVRRAVYDARWRNPSQPASNGPGSPLSHREHHGFHRHHHHAHPLAIALFAVLFIPSTWMGIFAGMSAAHSGSSGNADGASSAPVSEVIPDCHISPEMLPLALTDEHAQSALAWEAASGNCGKGSTVILTVPPSSRPRTFGFLNADSR